MTQRANYIKLGAFVLTGTVLLVGGLMVFGLREAFKSGITIETYMDESIQGLDIGSPVKYRGVKVGTVREIGFASQYYELADDRQSRYVVIRSLFTTGFLGADTVAELREHLNREIQGGMRVRLAPQGITGLAFLELDYIDPMDFPPLPIAWEPDELYVPSARARFEAIADSIEKVARELEQANISNLAIKVDELLTAFTTAVEGARVDEISEETIALIKEFRETNNQIQETTTMVTDKVSKMDVESIPTEISEAIREIRDTVHTVRSTIEDERERLGLLIDEITGTATDGRKLLASAQQTLDSEEVALAITQFQLAADRILEVSDDIPQTLNLINRNLRRVEMTLSAEQEDITVIIRNLYTITENLKNLTELASEYPSLLILGEAPLALEEVE
ncbi:MAG: MCE family protein [Candidatus Sumerlaeia bacterium]|nr:MCE family protein [Candidatus Sumerlaeia bacterium]